MNKLVAILTVTLVLTGCEALSNLLPKSGLPPGSASADLVVHANGVDYKFTCQIDNVTKALANCMEVK